MLGVAAKRVPIILAAIAVAGGAAWFSLSRGLPSELCSLEWIVLGLAFVGVIALVMVKDLEVFEVLALNAFFAALWAGSGALFLRGR